MLFYLFPPDYGPNTATSHCPPGVLSTPTPPHHQQHHFHPAVKAHGQSSLAFPKQLVDCCMDRFFFQNLQNFRSGFRTSDCNRITMQCTTQRSTSTTRLVFRQLCSSSNPKSPYVVTDHLPFQAFTVSSIHYLRYTCVLVGFFLS
jgi:hypothetical protein